MMAPAPMMMVQQTVAAPAEPKWKNPTHSSIPNECGCFGKYLAGNPCPCCVLKSKNVQTIQGKQCEFSGCNADAQTTCGSEVRFAPG